MVDFGSIQTSLCDVGILDKYLTYILLTRGNYSYVQLSFALYTEVILKWNRWLTWRTYNAIRSVIILYRDCIVPYRGL